MTITWGREATNIEKEKDGSVVDIFVSGIKEKRVEVEMEVGERMCWIGIARGIEVDVIDGILTIGKKDTKGHSWEYVSKVGCFR